MSAASSPYSVVHSASTANVTGFTYYEVYSGAGGGTATINGTPINFGEGSNMNIHVRTISDVTGEIYVLGHQTSVVTGSNTIGGTY